MNVYTDQGHQHTSRSVANDISQKQGNDSSIFQFTDNRPASLAQRKLQQQANFGSRSAAFNAVNSTAVNQLKTEINYSEAQEFCYGNKTDYVGKRVVADIDPKDPIQGSDTGGSEQDDLMHALPGHTSWVKGHLLNHDLGGRAIPWNLFPITKDANSEHYHEVEKPVKHWVGKGQEVRYQIDAIPENAKQHDNANGYFDCLAEITKGNMQGAKINKRIHSKTAKQDYTRIYSKKENKDVADKYSNVEHLGGNTVARDTYGTITKNKNWDHYSGNSGLNKLDYKKTDSLKHSGADADIEPVLVSGDNETWGSDITVDAHLESVGEGNVKFLI